EGAELAAPEPPGQMSALERSDAEDVVAVWLTGLNVTDPWELAPALVEAGWTTELLEEAVDQLNPDLATHFARWIALRTMAEQVIGEVGIGARRISELVRIVKEYSYLDQAPIQEIVPTAGIEDTLVLLKHKLRGIEVLTDFAEDLSSVEAPGRDLNQVWTNLIDNAADAMEDGGTLTMTARNVSDSVIITVADSGHGMPADVAERIFDPFFTTKEPGKGTGLGLHTVHTIISRVGGDITVDSTPDGTTFTVTLPAVVG
ncbi:MAG: sensor histidine kinase, partial [Actinobacteria bacterium]|nr:sensor histidine kinase [Actinomycetota bacterium]